MTAKVRSVNRQFAQTHSTKFKNILVSGCSFTYNNHESAPVTWPYYLRDFAGIEEVYDCSQMSSGSNHIFNSIVNEIETNTNINPKETLVLIMWSGLTRTDFIAGQDITTPWHNVSNYHFDSKFATLTVIPDAKNKTPVAELSKQYRVLIDPNAQIYESLLKIIALQQFLESKNFQYVFMSWMDPAPELKRVASLLTDKVYQLLDTVPWLWEYSVEHNLIGVNHPSPDGHLSWTKKCLIPWLTQQGLTTNLNAI